MEALTKILIVDDNERDRVALREALQSDALHPCAFFETGSVAEGVALCAEVEPDCILLDYCLTDGTGLDFIAQLPARPDLETLPIVMLTAEGDEEVAVAAMKAGVQDYLIKGKAITVVVQRAVRTAIERHRSRKKMAAQREEMDRLCAEAHVANTRKDELLAALRLAKEEADQANHAKDEFLATLSHELRTPLTPILSLVSAFDPATADRAELGRAFEMIRRNVEHEARLIDDLLELTRLNKGKLRLDLHPIEIEHALHGAMAISAVEIRRKNILLQSRFTTPGCAILADAPRFQQILLSILKNAIKFTSVGGKIEITTRRIDGERVEVAIADTGYGIEAGALSRIFQPFEQGDESVPRKFGGLGLGLAIAKALVEGHRGQIIAESAGRNQGSTFRITLPLATVAPGGRPVPEESNAAGAELGGSILLVEDHDDTAAVLARSLRRAGFVVRIANSVESAAICFQREHFDLLISDIGLPDGTGLDLLQRLNQVRRVPAIALSGYGMEHDLDRSSAAGFVSHITKPVSWDPLMAAVRSALAGSPAAVPG